MNARMTVLACGWLAAAAAAAQTTIHATNHLAYGANIGWIEMRGDVTNGVVVGQSYCTGYAWSANCGWICLGNGPTNGWRYSNLASNDWGVNHNGAGQLAGRAYGADIGWITFEQTDGRPQVDLETGKLDGYVWGANVGWIGLTNVRAHVPTDRLAPGPDTDGDGIPDDWEWRMAGDLATLSGGGHDEDGDGAPDEAEYPADTDPTDDASRLEIAAYRLADGTNRVEWTAQNSRFYELLRQTNLVEEPPAWSDTGLGRMRGVGPTMFLEVESPADGDVHIWGVRASVPLAE